MNGPFSVSGHDDNDVVDADGSIIVRGYATTGDEAQERAHAAMACNALNAVYYALQAGGAS